MKKMRIILLGVIFLSAFAFVSCGSQAKENKEGEKKECCEKKDTTGCEKKDSTSCEHKCEHKCAHESADSTKN